MSEFRAVIVDDEAFNRELIKTLLNLYGPGFRVVAEAENLRDSLDVITNSKPDVVFLDIKMPDGSGFDLLKSIPKRDFEIVFVTGFDEFALTAFEYSAIDYLLKPIDIDKFKITISRLTQRLTTGKNMSPVLEPALTAKIPLHYPDKVVVLEVADIMYIRCNGGTCTFFTADGASHQTSRSLRDFLLILGQLENFVFVQEVAAINVNFVSSYSKDPQLKVKMKDRTEFQLDLPSKLALIKALDRSLKV